MTKAAHTIPAAIGALVAEISALSSQIGQAVLLDPAEVADRRDAIPLRRPGLWSANRSCRLVRTADAWIAVNLPRESDKDLVPAWLGEAIAGDPWRAIARRAARIPASILVTQASLLGLPVCRVGETHATRLAAPARRMAAGVSGARRTLRVIDLSSLWAGPLCGSVLAQAGAAVTRIESRRRPDPTRLSPGGLFERLNGGKTQIQLDFNAAADIAALRQAIARADVVITSARPRAFDQFGLAPAALFAINPALTWVGITGHGFWGRGANRVAFGDDAAAAGGLVHWSRRGAPRFAGDAPADPLTGLAAAVAALKAIKRGGGLFIDAALARSAAGALAQYCPAGATP